MYDFSTHKAWVKGWRQPWPFMKRKFLDKGLEAPCHETSAVAIPTATGKVQNTNVVRTQPTQINVFTHSTLTLSTTAFFQHIYYRCILLYRIIVQEKCLENPRQQYSSSRSLSNTRFRPMARNSGLFRGIVLFTSQCEITCPCRNGMQWVWLESWIMRVYLQAYGAESSLV